MKQKRQTPNIEHRTSKVELDSLVILSRTDGEGSHPLELRYTIAAPNVITTHPALAQRLRISELDVGRLPRRSRAKAGSALDVGRSLFLYR